MTVQLLINEALRHIGVLASGETPNTEESADGLTALNQLISSWNAQALPIYSLTRDAFTLTGPGSYTIGSAGTFVTTSRMVKIEAAAVVTSTNISKPVRIVTVEEWTAFLDKAATGNFADVMYYDHGYPSGNIYLAPKPTGGTLEVYSYKPIASFAALSDSVAFPDGYERALAACLALDLAPQFGRPITQDLQQLAAESKTAIFGLNQAIVGHPNQAEPTQQPA